MHTCRHELTRRRCAAPKGVCAASVVPVRILKEPGLEEGSRSGIIALGLVYSTPRRVLVPPLPRPLPTPPLPALGPEIPRYPNTQSSV